MTAVGPIYASLVKGAPVEIPLHCGHARCLVIISHYPSCVPGSIPGSGIGVPGFTLPQNIGYVRGSPNGKICKSTNGTVGTIFTNGNQKTLNVFLLPMVPLVPLVDHVVEFLSYLSIRLTCFCLSYLLHVYCVIYNIYICMYGKSIAYFRNS